MMNLRAMASSADEQDDLGLDDALLARHHVLQRVVELERDQERQDLAEYRLEHIVIERVEPASTSPEATVAIRRTSATTMIMPTRIVRISATVLSKR
jgi:hypothetical protein